METRKLYYEDCHLSRFTARVLSCCPADKGWEVILDATAFYPEGGGQPCDLGMLGGVRVLDVQEREDTVVHLCDGPLEIGSQVEGVLDWERRFALMQQHTGEHILSGLVNRRWGYHNVGFHMGSQLMTVDFDGPIPQEELTDLEGAVNAALGGLPQQAPASLAGADRGGAGIRCLRLLRCPHRHHGRGGTFENFLRHPLQGGYPDGDCLRCTGHGAAEPGI